MVASYDESVLDVEGIVQAVEKAGYGAFPKKPAAIQNKSSAAGRTKNPETSTAQTEYKQMKQRLLISAIFTVPLFYISMGHMMGWPLPGFLLGMENALSFAFTQFLLLIPVVFVNFKCAVCINIEGDFDLRHTTGSRSDARSEEHTSELSH